MKVKEFVKTILKDVTEAVEESDEASDRYYFHIHENANDYIDFDLAVVLKKSGKGKARAKLFIAEGELKGEMSQEVVNRIKFRILPYKKSK